VLYGKNVLVAEDNQINAEVILKILSTKGIHAELASDGQEAVNLFSMQGAYHYQAILMDLMMPVLNGIEATRQIRRLNSQDAATIPIFALTADVTEDLEDRCRDAGIDGAIGKPINTEQLFQTLTDAFEKQLHGDRSGAEEPPENKETND
jgi:two-component system CheB/CheR fusion protein